MIRVLHVGSALDAGGVEMLLYNFYKNIDKSEFNFDFIVNSKEVGMIEKEFIKMGSIIHHIPGKKENIILYIYKLFKIIFAYPRYDIIHVHQDQLSFFPLFIAKLANIQVRIAHSHNAHMNYKFPINLLNIIFKKLTILFANSYFACSSDAAYELYGKMFVNKREVNIIKNAINVDKYVFNSQVRSKIRGELKVTDKLVVGNIGRLCYQKNQEFLIKVFSEVYKENDSAILIIIGEGELKDNLKKLTWDLGIDKKVMFLGKRDNVHELLQAMDVFVLPSHYEGLGIVAIEAQTADLNCILSDRVPKEVNVTGNIVFERLDTDISLWSKHILNSCKDSQRTNKKDIIVESGYDIEKETKKIEKIYKSLFNGDQK